MPPQLGSKWRPSVQPVEQRRLGSGIARGLTGWADVDGQIAALERVYAAASAPEEFRQIGLLCRALFVSTSYVVFDADRHLPDGAQLPKKDDAKNRLDYAIAVGRRHTPRFPWPSLSPEA